MKKGFTLVEIMIMVMLVSLLSLFSITNILRIRVNANETVAITALRTISTAMESYRAAQSIPAYPEELATLTDALPPYIDLTLSSAIDEDHPRQGYFYSYSRVSANQYTCTAKPAVLNKTGTRCFFVNETGAIRWAMGMDCDADSRLLESAGY
ncbi:MAG: type II secretion system protein [Candidatus Omnitrophota bacterium]|jgi:type II secretory pathway pseudopilin PulG